MYYFHKITKLILILKGFFLAYWNLIQTIVLNLTISMTQILALAIKLWCYNLFKNSIVQLTIIIIILLLLLLVELYYF